jgi:hypothetical protein
MTFSVLKLHNRIYRLLLRFTKYCVITFGVFVIVIQRKLSLSCIKAFNL